MKHWLILISAVTLAIGAALPDTAGNGTTGGLPGPAGRVEAAAPAAAEMPAEDRGPRATASQWDPTGRTETAIPTATGKPTETAGAARVSPAPETSAPATEKPEQPEETVVTITFTGDVTLGSEEILRGRAESFDSYAAREGYGWFFRNMKELFSRDDLTLVNLEGVLSDSSVMEDTRKTFRFRGPTDFAKILTQSSIEACAISNNHIMDYGRQGYDSTMAALEAEGIRYCGNDHAFVLEKNGIRIGFFALGSIHMGTYGSWVRNQIARMREEGVNAIVCSFHAGQEYAPRRRNRDQERFAKMAVEEWGADLVVMHHPHVLQGVDILRDRYVFYSLGNFCFGGNMVIRASGDNPAIRSLETAVLQMDLRFSPEGELLGQEGRIYPCFLSSSATKAGEPNDFQPRFVFGEEAQGVLKRIQDDTRFDLGGLDGDGILRLPYLNAAGETAPQKE